MINCFFRILFALSTVSPILLVASVIKLLQGEMPPGCFALLATVVAILIFSGGPAFLRIARSSCESIAVNGQIAAIQPSGQWLSVLIGSYLVPVVSLLQTAIDFWWIVAIVSLLVFAVLVCKNIPPALSLLLCGYSFYEFSFQNGAAGYKLISKRKVINDPRSVKCVARLFQNDYWYLEKDR